MSDNPLKSPTPADFFNWVGQYVQPMMENSLKMMSQMSANMSNQAQGAMPPLNGINPANFNTSDPFAFWRSFYEQNEQAWTKFMQQYIGTPEFAANLGTAATQQAMLQNNIRQTALSYLKAAHMPSQEDITRVATLVVGLDAKLDEVQDDLDEIRAQTDTSKKQEERINALEKRLGAIEGKLDMLLQLLQNEKPTPAPVEKPTRARKTPAIAKSQENKDKESKESEA